ncbi:hypothetical protein HGM15179_018710 [Zosterops borbonicus]|uniref:Uncharacterized protein n=1 Tax=Zosterops borbonicus TaxID=364589 RepID=A0A8K1DAM3_9PASS|nr:hypothetical protein HGM15179_018710 [Zosterops borbonicus]
MGLLPSRSGVIQISNKTWSITLKKPSSHLEIQFNRVIVDKRHRTVQLSDGPVKVTATMSNTTDSLLEVVLEEQGQSWEEVGIENLHLEKIENLLDLQGDLMVGPGTTWMAFLCFVQ